MNHIHKEEIDHVLGKILKKYRMRNRMTQEQLSEKLNISLKYISRIENGNGGIKTQTLIRYMNILGIEPNLLFSSFLTNSALKKQLDLSEKIQHLEPEKVIFLSKVVDELRKI